MGKIKIGLGLNCFILLSDFEAVCVHLSGLNKSVLRVLSLEWHLDCSPWQLLLSLSTATFHHRASEWNVDTERLRGYDVFIIHTSLWSRGADILWKDQITFWNHYCRFTVLAFKITVWQSKPKRNRYSDDAGITSNLFREVWGNKLPGRGGSHASDEVVRSIILLITVINKAGLRKWSNVAMPEITR